MLQGRLARRIQARRGSSVAIIAIVFPFILMAFVFAYDVVMVNVARKEATLVAQAAADAGASQFKFGAEQSGPDGRTWTPTIIDTVEGPKEACDMYDEAVAMNPAKRFHTATGSCYSPDPSVRYAKVTNAGSSITVEFNYRPANLMVLGRVRVLDLTASATAYRCDAAADSRLSSDVTNAASFTGGSCAAPTE